MKLFFKVFAMVFTLLFLWAAVLQWNDPDSWVWYSVYGGAAITSVLFFTGRLPYAMGLVFMLAYTVGAVYSWPEQFQGFTIGEGDINNIERGREAFGLFLTAAVMLVYALRIRYSSRS
jgi:hypothetical protein